MTDMCMYEDGVDWTDPIMWTDDDGQLITRVSEVLYNVNTDDIPLWWRQRMRDYIVLAAIDDAEYNNLGIIYDARTSEVWPDEFNPWGHVTEIFGANQERRVA